MHTSWCKNKFDLKLQNDVLWYEEGHGEGKQRPHHDDNMKFVTDEHENLGE